MEKTIILALTGSVATIKAHAILKELYKIFEKVTVIVVTTKNATHFLKDIDVKIMDTDDFKHLLKSDALLIAPLDANTLGKMVCGIQDNIITKLVFQLDKPIIVAPAMNTMMLSHPITTENLKFLSEWKNVVIVPTVVKKLACGDYGDGAMASPETIAQTIRKTQRYDRQLRLWQEQGQRALESTHLLCLFCTPAGTETLKNLILPGVGRVTIMDKEVSCHADLGNNFFIRKLNESRSVQACEYLQELNPNVDVNYDQRDPLDWLREDDNELWDTVNIVVVSDKLGMKWLTLLEKKCIRNGISLVIVRSVGLVGYVRVSGPKHEVWDPKNDNGLFDLRLDSPFEELLDSVDNFDLVTAPYPIILLKARQWFLSKYNKLPETKQEKEIFKKFIESNFNTNLENVQEALAQAHRIWNPVKINDETRNLISESVLDDSPFAVLFRSLGKFIHTHKGMWPLNGSLPDMHSTTSEYLLLQSIYQQKAKKDFDHFVTLVTDNSIPLERIKEFCKHCLTIKAVEFPNLDALEENGPGIIDNSLLQFYLALNVADRFVDEQYRSPGEMNDEIYGDLKQLVVSAKKLTDKWKCDPIDEQILHEVSRYGGAFIHPVSAVLGGVAAQEIIKLITHQGVPINNLFMFSGNNNTESAVFRY